MSSTTRSIKDRLFLVIKGLAMGAANKVPGVSGGLVAFVAGFYEEFIFSLQRFNGKALKLLFNFKLKSFAQYTNLKFLSLLILGMVLSYFSVSQLLDYLLNHYPLFVWSLFFGMIIGSVYYINKDFNAWNFNTRLSLFIGAAVGLGISFLDPATQNDNLWFVFFCGLISVSGMTLPGFSGSFILILLGNYVLLLVDSVNALYDTISDLTQADMSFLSNTERMRMLKILGVFTLGSVVGLVSFSHILNYILKHYKNITTSTIVGFIIGSLGVVWPWKETVYKLNLDNSFALDSSGKKIVENYNRFIPQLTTETFYAIIYIGLGVLIILALDWYGKKTLKAK